MSRVRVGFLIEFSALKDVIARSRDEEAGRAWLKAKKFVESGKYSSCKYAGELAGLVLAGYDDEYIGYKFGIAVETVRGHRRKIGMTMDDIFGKDFCELFYNFKENSQEIHKRLSNLGTVGLVAYDLLPREVVPTSRDGIMHPKFEIAECLSELAFLERHSLATIEKEKKFLDFEKILYLIDVIDGSAGTFSDRAEVLKNIVSTVEE